MVGCQPHRTLEAIALWHCTPARWARRAAAALAVGALSLTVALGAGTVAARADGDPASDVLAGQSLFLPQDAGASATQQAQLSALLAEARQRGYRLRVAVIASTADLGSITELWRQPEEYARFLGQELGLVYQGTVLVVMPNGYGVATVGGGGPGGEGSATGSGPAGTGSTAGSAEGRALSGLPAPGAGLGTATLSAVGRLAASAGHPLAVPAAGAPSAGRGTDVVAWLVFVLGAAVAAAAWAVSLRIRPPGLRRPFGAPVQRGPST